jgi:carboxyl-terminal processing protease
MSVQIVQPQQQAEEFGGIGAVINKDQATGQMIVAELLPNGAAAKAGMLQGDIIAEVNGVPTQTMELVNVISLIRGPVGSSVEVAVSRGPAGGPLQRLSIIRELVKLPDGGRR